MDLKEIRHMYVRTCVDRLVTAALSARRALMNFVRVCISQTFRSSEGLYVLAEKWQRL